MAEVDTQKVLTLAEQYSLPNKEEKPVQAEVPVEEKHDQVEVPVEEKPVQVEVPHEESKDPIDKIKEESPISLSEEPAVAKIETVEETPAPKESNEAAEPEESSEKEVTEETPEIKLVTTPADFRFPTTNQSRHCFTRYVEYHRCIKAKGDDAPECDKFAKYYRSLCPGEWIERWNEQRENGTFPGPL